MGVYNEKLKISTQKYIKNNYDILTAYAPKGSKAVYRDYAESLDISLNQLIVTLLDKEMTEKSLKAKK